MCNESLWNRLIPLFDDSYEFIHLKIPQKENFDEIIEEIDKKIIEDSTNILGFSLGGYIALHYALKYPKKIEKLMLVSSSFNSLKKDEIEKREAGLNFIKQFGFKTLSKKAVQVMLDKSNIENLKLIKQIQDMYNSLGEENLFSQMKSTLYREDLTNKLIRLNVNILFVYSIYDNLLDTNTIEKMVLKNKNFKSKTFESTSHMLTLEKPFELKEIIKKWFI
jgi:pimeloyl-ACP methyl ester carboxylesterase